ncbi:hypothetical protein, partial [Ferrimicrobium sp.]|uniref:hypothetical protein n=1 Tax=Ferrimicrobium sp. TaxID=2926050 RepID=UPI002634C037
CLVVVDVHPPVPRPLGTHQCHAVLMAASVQLFGRQHAVLDVRQQRMGGETGPKETMDEEQILASCFSEASRNGSRATS